MIAFNPAMWMLSGHCGEKVPFDANQLRVEIVEAFFLAGHPQEAWLADEIISGVEFAVSQLSKEEQNTFTLNHVSDLVAQMLEQTHHHDVAEVYLHLQFPADDELPGSKTFIFSTLTEYFEDWSPAVLADLTDDVFNILILTGFSSPTKSLIYELALNLSKHKAKFPLVTLPSTLHTGKPKIILDNSGFLALLTPKTKQLFNKKILDAHPIGSLFPSLHLRVNWIHLIDEMLPKENINEFTFYPVLYQLAEKISLIADKVKEHLHLETLPVSIEMIQTEDFVREKLLSDWNEKGKRLAQEFLNEFASRIEPEPFKLLLF